MDIRQITIEHFKKLWREKPYMSTNDMYLEWAYLVMDKWMHSFKERKQHNQQLKCLLNMNKECIAFSQWQEHLYKTFQVSELAEIIDEKAFQIYVVTRNQHPTFKKIWEQLGWETEAPEEAREADAIY